MDGFTIFIICVLVAMVLAFMALGKWYPGSGADVLDWKPTRSLEAEIELEQDDVQQMIDAQNERRRRSGRPDLTEDGVRAQVAAEQAELRRQRDE
ncbi:MAG: hypothetical protein QOG63_3098 [Thermoleophilaceae bacterium]|nr:hypothetical protein [Thermoleophilaceae bacterium]